jgi:serine/threonine protein kinase
VHHSKDTTTATIVAVKIIDLDESDTVNPRRADSYSESMKEIGALKLLSENKARNINHIIDSLLVDQTMWMVTEYCGGGSVATLVGAPCLPCERTFLFGTDQITDEAYTEGPTRKMDRANTSRSCGSSRMGPSSRYHS